MTKAAINIATRAAFSGLLMLLAGCSDHQTVKEMCDNNPHFCTDLNDDGWCRYPRADVIDHRFALEKTPSDDNRYQMLLTWEKYRDCIQLAADVRQLDKREAAANRMRGYLTSLKEIDELAAATRDSDYPYLLFWHWSREGREAALEKLLEADKRDELNISEIQYRLGTYYAKSDPDLAIKKMLYALELLPKKENFSGDIITSLATLYYRSKNPENAYVWMHIAELAEVEGASSDSIAEYLRLTPDQRDELDDKAEEIYDQIQDRKFVPPR